MSHDQKEEEGRERESLSKSYFYVKERGCGSIDEKCKRGGVETIQYPSNKIVIEPKVDEEDLDVHPTDPVKIFLKIDLVCHCL